MTILLKILSLFIVLLFIPLSASSESRLKKDINDDVNTERKIALVIGNSSYKSSPLRNPVNDADNITSKLRILGFQITKERDA